MNSAIVLIYNETVTELSVEDPNVTLGAIREAMLPKVSDLLAACERDLDREARDAIEKVVIPERERRSRSLRKNIDYIVDAVTSNPEQMEFIETELRMAFPTGDARGVDKLLCNWRASDLHEMAIGRYRSAANAMKEAREMDDSATRLANLMNSRGASVIGDLFSAESAAT